VDFYPPPSFLPKTCFVRLPNALFLPRTTLCKSGLCCLCKLRVHKTLFRHFSRVPDAFPPRPAPTALVQSSGCSHFSCESIVSSSCYQFSLRWSVYDTHDLCRSCVAGKATEQCISGGAWQKGAIPVHFHGLIRIWTERSVHKKGGSRRGENVRNSLLRIRWVSLGYVRLGFVRLGYFRLRKSTFGRWVLIARWAVIGMRLVPRLDRVRLANKIGRIWLSRLSDMVRSGKTSSGHIFCAEVIHNLMLRRKILPDVSPFALFGPLLIA